MTSKVPAFKVGTAIKAAVNGVKKQTSQSVGTIERPVFYHWPFFVASANKNGSLLNKGAVMTNRITLAASEVRVNDHVYNGAGTNAHPTFAWETVTEVRSEDGLILLITGNIKGLHGEFWLEPDEQIVVMRYPESTAAKTPT